MGLVGLEFVLHDDALLEEIRQSCHDDGVEHVYLEEETVANVEPIEGNTLDQGDPSHVFRIIFVLIAPVADGQGMVDGKVQAINVGTH